MRRRIDWAAIHAHYVNSSLTYADLSAQYQVSATALRRRASREHWTRDKAARADSLLEQTSHQSIVDSAAELARLNQVAGSNPDWEPVYLAAVVAANTSLRPVEVKQPAMEERGLNRRYYPRHPQQARK